MREKGEEISGRHKRGDPSGSEPQAKQAHASSPPISIFHRWMVGVSRYGSPLAMSYNFTVSDGHQNLQSPETSAP
ncbi:hypothetical protein GQ457_03G004270 [Hibiscus cannabinus]